MIFPRLALFCPLVLVAWGASAQTARPEISSRLRFGAASIHVNQTRETRWLSSVVPARQVKKTLRGITKSSGPLRFDKGAPGSYQVFVSGQGNVRGGRIRVEVVIRGVREGAHEGAYDGVGDGVSGALIEVRGQSEESWPHVIPTGRPDPATTQIYPRIQSRYRPKDKDGNPIYTSHLDAIENAPKERSLPLGDDARSAFGRALKKARREAEAKITGR